MYKLSLQYDANSFIHLDGASVSTPVKGARYAPGRGARQLDENGREIISEEIVIELAGTYREITDWITALLQQVELLHAGAWHKPGLPQLRLCVQEADDSTGARVWHSAILRAALTLDPAGLAQRALGQQLVTLTVTRLDRWVNLMPGVFDLRLGDGVTLQSEQGYLLNHHDATSGHSNWGYVPAANVAGSLATDSILQISTDPPGHALGDLYIGCGWTDDADPAYSQYVNTLQQAQFAAGPGVIKTVRSSTNSAAGYYAEFTWAAAGEALICKAAIPTRLYATRLSQAQPFKPMGRLEGGLAASDVWLKSRILLSGTGTAVYETEWTAYPGGSPLIELPPVYLPPAGMVEAQGLDFALYALRPTAASYTFNLNYFQLWPVDGGFRKLKCSQYQSGPGKVLDNGELGTVYGWQGSGAERAVYAGLGKNIRLFPGRCNVLAVANIQNGTTWQIDDPMVLWMNIAPAKRDL